MEKIISVQQPSSLFNASYTLAIRIWHWLTAITMTATIITVLLASTLFTMRSNIPEIQQDIQSKGGTVTAVQARAVAHSYNDKFWELHTFIGYGLCFLLLVRGIIEVNYSKEKKLRTRIREALQLKTSSPYQKEERRHYLLVKWGYVIFYLLFLVMGLTGLGMALEDVPFFRSIRPAITSIHEFTQYLIYAYILAHIVGVIRADLTNSRGIVSRMINGGDHS